MLSNEHESLAEMFRHQPSLAAELAAALGVDVPRFANARLEPSDYSDVMPTEWRSELAMQLPELAVLSAIAHGEHPDIDQILEALVQGLKVIKDADHCSLYTDVVLDALPDAVRQQLEELMDLRTYEFKSDYIRGLEAKGIAKGIAKGEVEGKADAVLAVLAARGVDVPYDAREHVTSCTDADQLDEWVRRAAVATSVDELFD